MKPYFMQKIFLLVFATLLYHHASGWGTDKVISPFSPTAQHSLAVKQNGVLYAALAGAVTGPDMITVYTSSDNGDTWNVVPLIGLPAMGAVVKTKMVVTGLDSIYCVFSQNNVLYFLNVETGTLGQFTQSGIQDFDCVASPGSNWIYVFVQEPLNNDIRRHGTLDGGISFTGNSALVTGNGDSPKICMSGTRLILNYYGPVLPDTATSDIVAAFYDETAPGTIAPGTFQDVVTSSGMKRKQFKTVLVNSTAWFLFTEGDTNQQLKCKTSVNNGTTYQPEFIVGGNTSLSAYWFDAAAYSNLIGSGVTLTYLADSIAPTGTGFDQMQFVTASALAPGSFTTFLPPNNTHNDTSVATMLTGILPVVINYSSSSVNETGIAWAGISPQGPWLYFDRLNALVGINESLNTTTLLVFPSPARDVIQVKLNNEVMAVSQYLVVDAKGRTIITGTTNSVKSASALQIDISSLTPGNYVLKLVSEKQTNHARFVVM